MTRLMQVLPSRVWRTYSGGRELETWLGQPDPKDSEYPEDWLASLVSTAAGADRGEGLGETVVDGERRRLIDLVREDPESMLGATHLRRHGTAPGLLCKIIDSSVRLTIQVHPDGERAARWFGSPAGKTETWCILGGRTDSGAEPYVLLGFKPRVTRERWKALFEAQDIPGMVDALHRIPVRPGDVLFVPGGVPHAIGEGCFLMEVQEPTDITLRSERTTPDGKRLDDLQCHFGVGFDVMLDCFDYEPRTLEETLGALKIPPRLVRELPGCEVWELIGPRTTDLFGMRRLVVSGTTLLPRSESYSILTVVSGRGFVGSGADRRPVRGGDRFFVPAALGELPAESAAGSALELVECLPG